MAGEWLRLADWSGALVGSSKCKWNDVGRQRGGS
jgi:hypothetical protein